MRINKFILNLITDHVVFGKPGEFNPRNFGWKDGKLWVDMDVLKIRNDRSIAHDVDLNRNSFNKNNLDISTPNHTCKHHIYVSYYSLYMMSKVKYIKDLQLVM